MKVFFALLIVALSASHLPGQSLPQAHPYENQLRKLVAEFGEAFVKADVTSLERLLTDDYIHTNTSGTVLNKQQWLAYIQSRKAELETGKLTIDSYVNEDLKVQLHGNTAIVTGRSVTAGKRDGQPFVTRLRFTHLWVKSGKQWRRAAFHDSTIPQ